jgi:cobalt-zinc-cadmium resistance protein CzcA
MYLKVKTLWYGNCLDQSNRSDINDLKNLYVTTNGEQIPLQELASIEYTEGPCQNFMRQTNRRIVVGINVRKETCKVS